MKEFSVVIAGGGSTYTPGIVMMLMDSLELVGAQGKDLVRYTFSFTEWEGRGAYAGSGTYCAQAGESLWQYANRWGLSIEKLVEANPHIRDICALEEGEKVMLP